MKKTFNKSLIFTTILILGLITFSLCTYQVNEVEQVIVLQFGEIVKVVIDEKNNDVVQELKNDHRFKDINIRTRKGLQFKVPFIQTVENFDQRLFTYDTSPREVTTKDKKKLILDNNAQWAITNPATFKLTMGNERNAHRRIDDLLYSKLNEHIGKTEAHVMIADKEYVNGMLEDVASELNIELQPYGIHIADIRIKRTDLPTENSQNIFNRMRTEREQQAKKYRSEGKEEAQRIKSEADKEATIIEAQAISKAEEIKGLGDATATEIYNQAYSQDPDFYEFYRTLQSYKKTIDDNTTIVIDKNSPFTKYLFGK